MDYRERRNAFHNCSNPVQPENIPRGKERLRDEYELQFSDIFDQIVAYAAGSPINVVNPAVLLHVRSATAGETAW
jgi:hypothetical protein